MANAGRTLMVEKGGYGMDRKVERSEGVTLPGCSGTLKLLLLSYHDF